MHSRAVTVNVVTHRMVGSHGAGDDESDLALLEQVGGGLPGAGLRTAVPRDLEAEQAAEHLRGLKGVAHPPLQVGEPLDREAVARRHRLGASNGVVINRHGEDPSELLGAFWRVCHRSGWQMADGRWQMVARRLVAAVCYLPSLTTDRP